MYYICVENDRVISVLDYEPNVPSTVSVTVLSNEDFAKLDNQTHYFDIETKRYLDNTDWMVLRHIRQKALGIPTSLSESEYLDLELERNRRAASITR